MNTYTYDTTGVHIANQSGTVYSYIKDHHGNIIGTATSAGTMVQGTTTRMDYDAFGNQWIGGTPDPFGYCGEYLDSESGLIYLRNRYYDSTTGRFITEDPVKDGLNWYSYCSGNPVAFVDPRGLERYDEDDIMKLRQSQQVVIAEQEETVDIYIALKFSGNADATIMNSNETYREACIRGIKGGWTGEFEYKRVNVYIDDASVDNPNNYMTTDINIDINAGVSHTSYFLDVQDDRFTANNYSITINSGDNRNNHLYTNQDVALVAGHEFGHALGIGDLYDVKQFESYISMMNNQWNAERAQYGDYMMMFIARNTGSYLLFSSGQNPDRLSGYENTILEQNRNIAKNYFE